MKRQPLKYELRIKEWLDKYQVANYIIREEEVIVAGDIIGNTKPNKKWVVDLEGSLVLSHKATYLPIDFGVVKGDVILTNMSLQSLEGCPHTVGGDFKCDKNLFTSLEYGPKSVGKNYDVANNRLNSLLGCPTNIAGNFFCDNNLLKTLEHCPTHVKYDFSCENNPLETLKFCPEFVGLSFCCGTKHVLSLEGFTTDFKEQLIVSPSHIVELRAQSNNYPHTVGINADSGMIQNIVATLAEKRLVEASLPQLNSKEGKTPGFKI